MVTVGHKTIIQRTLDRLQQDGIKDVVVNLHHLGDILEDHLKDCTAPAIIFSKEDDLLETGAVPRALHYFNDKPFT